MTDAEIQNFVTRFAAAWAAQTERPFSTSGTPRARSIRRW